MLPDIPGGALLLCAGLAVVLGLAGLVCFWRRHPGNSHPVKLVGLPRRSLCRKCRHGVVVVQELHETDRIASLAGNLTTGFHLRDFWGWGIVTTKTACLRPSPHTWHTVLMSGGNAAAAAVSKCDERKHLLVVVLEGVDYPEPLTIAETTCQIPVGTKVLVCGYQEVAPDRMVQYESEASIACRGSFCECLEWLAISLSFRRLDPDTRFLILDLGDGVASEGSPVILNEEVIGMISYVQGRYALVLVAEEIQLVLFECIAGG
jgi:hypothetical protein